MKLKNRLSGVQVSVPDALAEELLDKGTYQTPEDYDADERERAAAERDRLAVIAGLEDDGDGGVHRKPTAAEKRAQAKAEKEAAEAAEREAAEKAAADAAAAGN
ncbi:hypothetical protein Jolie2_8 [Mycobacterium phage Jolie2]|uniref:Uncharacterized protein n=1 Tax=Mycobacterium phage Jolie2 TaxID=1458831 RepID=W8EAY5_9CAUD|nr:hypothetical protein Jolie2_8 [Mycobacterium phage Jolie2]AHJ86558.1 hypothetical protein Jolie2_8 [Mycobacterium phage Jolie2]